MYPLAKKGRKFLINVPYVRFPLFTSPPGRVSGPPLPENLWRIFSFDFLFKFVLKTATFGRSLAHLILATLLLFPFGVKEGSKRRFSSAMYPFGWFCLFTYPFRLWAPGASWVELLGLRGLDSGLLRLFGAY